MSFNFGLGALGQQQQAATSQGAGLTASPALGGLLGSGSGLGLGGGIGGTPLGGGLGAASGVPTATSSSGLSLGGIGGGLSSATQALGAAAAAAAPQQAQQAQQPAVTQSTLTFKVLEDYINKWVGDLDLQEKDFINQATQLNALDKLMIENGEKASNKNNYPRF